MTSVTCDRCHIEYGIGDWYKVELARFNNTVQAQAQSNLDGTQTGWQRLDICPKCLPAIEKAIYAK
jgi:hypothetical protein